MHGYIGLSLPLVASVGAVTEDDAFEGLISIFHRDEKLRDGILRREGVVLRRHHVSTVEAMIQRANTLDVTLLPTIWLADESREEVDTRRLVATHHLVVRGAKLKDERVGLQALQVFGLDLGRGPEKILPRHRVALDITKAEGAAGVDVPLTVVVVEQDQRAIFLRRASEVGPIKFCKVLGILTDVEEAVEPLGDQVPGAIFQHDATALPNDGMQLGAVDLRILEVDQRKRGMAGDG